MARTWKALLSAVTLAVTLAPRAAAASPSPEALLRASDSARGGVVSGVRMEGEVASFDDGKKGREYRMTIEADSLNSLVTFTYPPRSKGIKMLMLRRNMWFISPEVHKPVPISPRQRLLGDANNGDIASVNFSRDYAAESAADGEVDGEVCHVLMLKARSKDATYDRVTYYVSRTSLLGLKAEFHTLSGKLMKTARYVYGEPQPLGGRKVRFVSKAVITSPADAGAVTEILYSQVSFGKVPADRFDLSAQSR